MIHSEQDDCINQWYMELRIQKAEEGVLGNLGNTTFACGRVLPAATDTRAHQEAGRLERTQVGRLGGSCNLAAVEGSKAVHRRPGAAN